jgi:putative transcriptional regulator
MLITVNNKCTLATNRGNKMNNLKRLRQKSGLTQLELAKKIEMTKATISNYETGFRKPSLEVAQRIALEISCSNFNYSVDDLFPLKKAS